MNIVAWIYVLAMPALGGTGFYHPDDIAQASALFARASASLAEPLDARTATAGQMAAALAEYREGVDLLGERAAPEAREHVAEVERQYNRQLAKVQAFADTLIEDFTEEFERALARALRTSGATATECPRTIPEGRQLPGMPQRTKPNPACVGDDLNETLAAALDADAALKAAIDEILAIEWPPLEVPTRTASTVGGADRYLSVRTLLRAGAGDALRAIDREDDDARLDFQLSIQEGASKEELSGHVEAAREITARTAAKRAELASAALEAADGILDKWQSKGEPATGWCANPALLGGCAGTDATEELVRRLLDQKKVAKALSH